LSCAFVRRACCYRCWRMWLGFVWGGFSESLTWFTTASDYRVCMCVQAHQKIMIPTNNIYGFATFDLSHQVG
jgi:hypothetical protein